jgi:hypothetical protein
MPEPRAPTTELWRLAEFVVSRPQQDNDSAKTLEVTLKKAGEIPSRGDCAVQTLAGHEPVCPRC